MERIKEDETAEEMIERIAIELGIKKNKNGTFDFDQMLCDSCQ